MIFTPILPWWALTMIALVLLAGVGLVARGRRKDRRQRGTALRAATMVLLLLMAAWRPGIQGAAVPVANSSLDVFFMVDTTSSSVAEDYDGGKPRLDGMKADLHALAAALPGARYSMMTFDSTARTTLPLTRDAGALGTDIDILTTELTAYSHGSTPTVANDLLVSRLQAAKAADPRRPRIVFYLGDGEPTTDTAPPPFNIPVGLVNGGAVLGYGTAAGGKMKENFGYGSHANSAYITLGGQEAVSKIDEPQLTAMASQLGVSYTHRSAGDPISAALADTKPGTMALDADQTGQGTFELYWILALGAFALVSWELVVSGRRLREVYAAAQGRQ